MTAVPHVGRILAVRDSRGSRGRPCRPAPLTSILHVEPPPPPPEPDLWDVLADLAERGGGNGYAQTSPTPYLSGDEAQLQADVFESLTRLGVKGLRD